MAKPPKMRLPYAPNQLRLVQDDQPQAGPTQEADSKPLYTGFRYTPAQRDQWFGMSNGHPEQAGWVADFQFDQQHSLIKPFAPNEDAFLWDSAQWDDIPKAAEGLLGDQEFQLLDASLGDLSIEPGVSCPLLTIAPSFSIQFKTSAAPACLGEVRLVTGKRFVTLADGSQYSLLDTEPAAEPVLYLDDQADAGPIQQRTDWQSANTAQNHVFSGRISQPLISSCQNQPVQTITILEHYSSYLMQRLLTESTSQSIWTPLQAPITWGWSIRVEPDAGDWIITRRKLISPIVGHDGMELPLWHSNYLEYRHDFH